MHKALEDNNPAKILKVMQRNGYAGVLYHYAWANFQTAAVAE